MAEKIRVTRVFIHTYTVTSHDYPDQQFSMAHEVERSMETGDALECLVNSGANDTLTVLTTTENVDET